LRRNRNEDTCIRDGHCRSAGRQGVAVAGEPADKELIPAARAVLNYLESVYRKKCIAALNGMRNVSGVQEASGQRKAIMENLSS
jgi:hypothetical protein